MTSRRTAIVVGVLFVIALGLDIWGRGIYEAVLYAPDFLDRALPSQSQLTLGIMLELFSGIAVVLIPVVLSPVFKRHNEALAPRLRVHHLNNQIRRQRKQAGREGSQPSRHQHGELTPRQVKAWVRREEKQMNTKSNVFIVSLRQNPTKQLGRTI